MCSSGSRACGGGGAQEGLGGELLAERRPQGCAPREALGRLVTPHVLRLAGNLERDSERGRRR